MKILVGTNNENKLRQFRRIFNNLNFESELLSLKDAGIKDDIKEDGNTLIDNAKKKAKYYAEKSNLPTLADDTGLFIDALNGEPGVHAKRWHAGTEKDRYMMILERMRGEDKRSCRYIGALAFYNPENKEFWTYEKSIEGKIAYEPKDVGGFGYDAIFISLDFNKYYSELTDEEKDKILHRTLGAKELVKYLKES
ncbi:MAG: hypothetical protein A2365_04020 [Candidatus Nealsonbacteria bacterium RIFOXYB1_FULL_40_15]|uniref:Uncharacterized protein n=2 Tax=Candidatus Nealsoniibacteriota TaxID=1817911 RepID=A0A1G2EMU6_9BACT|nr:MAG: hypothetical protein A2427_04495 [Candidatus Nealsonbacteria bacterium RIFOXYC1_FULL_40_7]OGZ27776.1 MAG: hypothetical protein A2365_04020 [Candidatus Nealsonbacteria bacterium RIFOXYB1_FULL_40_15]OGZ28618.1 MAG: hypothetical protein A2562_03720 [Candidatus Nealsonbacteria bacterium RIFOXYD1_FULL_39_11]